MSSIRNLILAFAVMAGLAPAVAQAPPPVPALPDTERRTTYSISASTCACAVGFQLYGDSTDYANWIEVWINGQMIPASQWTVTSPSGPLATIPRPITDAVLTFNTVQTGTVQIVGATRPRRTSQFAENRGVAARDLNQAITYIVAGLREVWDKINDVTGRTVRTPPGETLTVLPPVSGRANMNVCFDSGGNIVPCVPVTSGSIAAGTGIIFAGTNPTTISTQSVANPVISPQGRLTLTSGTAIMSSSVAGATRVYYTPSTGTSVPIYDGTNLNPVAFPEVFQDTTDTTKSPAAVGASSCYDMFAWLDGVTPRVTRGPAWTNITTRSAGTALTLLNGIYLNAVSITNGPAASRGTYVGTICSNGSSTIDYILGGSTVGGLAAVLNVWNAYNRVPVNVTVTDTTASWTYTFSVSAVYRAVNGSNSNRVTFVRGLDVDSVSADYATVAQPSGTSVPAYASIGLDSVTAAAGSQGFVQGINATAVGIQGKYAGYPGVGQHYLQAVEQVGTSGNVQFFGGTTPFSALTARVLQ